MAYARISAKHLDILDEICTLDSGTASLKSTMATGPFKSYAEAYLFAASLGLYLNSPSPAELLNSGKTIAENIITGQPGGKELPNVAWLTYHNNKPTAEGFLAQSLNEITKQDLTTRFEILNRYAYSGFEWLVNNKDKEGSVIELVLSAFDRARPEVHDSFL